MLLSKNKIKYLSSLKLKKFRDEHRQFIAEGDKLVGDVLKNRNAEIKLLAASSDWLHQNSRITGIVKEIYEAGDADLKRISSFETPPAVIALADIPDTSPDFEEAGQSLSIGLDNVRDPGNLGTIIRTADWFGIKNVFCSQGCAELYNPKTIQASMGAIFNVRVHYVDFIELFNHLSVYKDFITAGTFMNGIHVNSLKGIRKGIIIFGNESRGLTGNYTELLLKKVTVPSVNPRRDHVESLNVASSVAAVLALITETNTPSE